MFEDQLRCNREAIVEECRIDTALEALARVAGQREFLPRSCDMFRREISAFDQDVGCGFGHARMFAAHDAADIMHHRVVSDHCHAGIKRVGLAIERFDLFAVGRLARN